MKESKIYAIVIVVLIISMLAQIVYFKNRKTRDNSTASIQENIIEAEDIAIVNLDQVYEQYNGNVQQKDFKNSIYNLITKHIISIKENTIDNKADDNEKYYIQNKEEINNMGICSEKDFVLIAEDIKNVLKDRIISVNKIETKIDENPHSKSGYYKFIIEITYNNFSKIYLKCYLKENDSNETKIIYESNSQLAQLFEKYQGHVNEVATINVLNTIINNAKNIHENTNLSSINKEIQYYNENKALFNDMGIYTEQDFQSIVSSIKNQITWNSNTEFNYYTVDIISYIEKDDYASVNIILNYNYSEQISIKLYLAIKDEVTPSIKLAGSEEAYSGK